MNIIDLKKVFFALLKENNAENLYSDLNLILENRLKINKTQLLLGDKLISNKEYGEILKDFERLLDGEPVQYIINKCEFMSLNFYVDSNVLIPRADTEILVEVVIDKLKNTPPLTITDICTGSGCIAISLAHYLKSAKLYGIDISRDALNVAEKNAIINNVLNRTEFLQYDILTDTIPFVSDCVISNPPYIRKNVIPTLDDKVKLYEPTIALDGGNDGLIFYKRISSSAPLKQGGLLAFEIGYDQGEDVYNILKQNHYHSIEIAKDLEGRDRVISGIKS